MWVSSFGNGMKVGSSSITPPPSDVDNISREQFGLSIYPNPATNMVHLVLAPQSQQGVISVYDVSGCVITRIIASNIHETEIDVSQWPSGKYLFTYKGSTISFIKE